MKENKTGEVFLTALTNGRLHRTLERALDKQSDNSTAMHDQATAPSPRESSRAAPRQSPAGRPRGPLGEHHAAKRSPLARLSPAASPRAPPRSKLIVLSMFIQSIVCVWFSELDSLWIKPERSKSKGVENKSDAKQKRAEGPIFGNATTNPNLT